MALRSPTLFSGAFLLLAIAYTAYFDFTVRTDAGAAQYRFDVLMESGMQRRAARVGENVVAMRVKEGWSDNEVAPLRARVAEAQLSRRNHDRASTLLREALTTDWAKKLTVQERVSLEDKLARAYIRSGQIEDAASIYASFLEMAGDAAADPEAFKADSVELMHATRVANARDDFAGALNHAAPYEISGGSLEQMLATTSQMAALGSFYGMRDGDEYAAAGLLSSAYQARKRLLGGDNQDTVQLTLILGPLYSRMGRLKDAEQLYLDAFHAQERVKGSNSPDLSLYIKLLAGIYEQQNRFTEAQALNVHMRALFQDAFGAQRYSSNREVDRRRYINRPVSQYFPLEQDYAPGDLVSAAEYSVPTSKAPNIDEMKLRLAPDQNEDPREANLPVRLAQLISLCRAESEERISLRSGYRSYGTQRVLHERNGARGTVTPPGVSEHQTGLAADINVNDRFMRQSDRAYQCFEENGFRYGFILSYPPDNDYLPGEDTYEPWHWRYVGIQTAQLYREAGPYNKPQEFLGALPCYRERAASGIFPAAGEPDICREAPSSPEPEVAENENDHPIFDKPETARILNNNGKVAQGRQ